MSGIGRPTRWFGAATLLLVSLSLTSSETSARSTRYEAIDVDLVLLIVVDQLRGDMLWRSADKFAEGGFLYLLENGAVFRNAHYRHAATTTCSGHATIVTGGNPPEHGMPGNYWRVRGSGARNYCVQDRDHKLLGEPTAQHAGTSPRNLAASTISDELVRASGGKSRAFAVSAKDRGAIIPAGKLGKAFWFSDGTGRFVTSSYYYGDAPPAWVRRWNREQPAERYRGSHWSLLRRRDIYSRRSADDRPVEVDYLELGRTFPHPLPSQDGNTFYKALRATPFIDTLTSEFTDALLAAEALGKRRVTDMLSVSFSATDMIGHRFGPDSLEAEDNLLRLDRSITRLLQSVDRHVGLDRTLIVLTADHGVADTPGHLGASGWEMERGVLLDTLNAALAKRFDGHEGLVSAYEYGSLYLDPEAIDAVSAAGAERIVAEEARKLDGVERAYTRTDILAGRVMGDPISRKVVRGFHPERSGDVVLVFAPGVHVSAHQNENAASHGSPYSYDTYVPVIFSGPHVVAGPVDRRIGPEDIAPTLAVYLGLVPPSGAVGSVLPEVSEPARPGRADGAAEPGTNGRIRERPENR